ncbi:hypothetical protein ACFO8O_02940 [Hephaestia sp. GCM10023244]|uniref:PAS domain-containing protein n=1 Tax=unclassified Hephaestia TaxID=2631281 RepID=UPI0020776605|nr:hypothetical protein [Hephaestia sp. MAHUQ-44]MCM8729926.1 hypothetical protein [Hephaestia sp. MAHUQ-44]
MDTLRGLDDDRTEIGHDEDGNASVNDVGHEIGTDERRMHVRAYNHWVSLLGGRPYPAIDDLDPTNISDFGPNSVLLDFSGGIENPAIRFLGRALRDECGLDSSITSISDVPSRSLLSRLTDHYLQIIANRAPIGFEAEFVGTRGNPTRYRGILMPFSSDEDTIDFIYGVINWKELVDAATQKKLDIEVDTSLRAAPRVTPTAPAWADGPRAEGTTDVETDDTHIAPDAPTAGLADQLLLAQQTAAAARAADTRTRAALYRALGRAHDFALAAAEDEAAYAALLAEAGIKPQARAPMTAIAKLVFGSDYDKTRLTEFATVLAYARRNAIGAGALIARLDQAEGGIKGIVQAERAFRRPVNTPDATKRAVARLAKRAPIASVTLATEAATGDYVLLLARASGHGTLDIVASVDGSDALTERVIRRAAH